MSIIVPNDGDLQRALPQIQNLSMLDTGGFKAVYRVTLEGRPEALKVIQIPASDGSTDAEAFKSEMIGRVRREVEALGRCRGLEIVKLGTLPLTALTINGVDYVAYSEEFLEGSDLWRLLNSGGPRPAEQELRLLFVTLLRAVREAWALGPNILIPNSLNSIEAVIAKNFIRLTKPEYAALKDPRPVYATLAVSRNALMDKQELVDFVNEITLLDQPPDGFYVLISARNTEARSDIYHADVIAAWMYINHTLSLNGFRVINGYSDILTPFLGAAGGGAGALGWWSNLKVFSLDRFAPPTGGGRLPIQRYLSLALLNRITFFEFDQLRTLFPPVLNKLAGDALYDAAEGSQPQRNLEVIQSWEAIKALNTRLLDSNQPKGLKQCAEAVKQAGLNYDAVQRLIRLDQKSNAEHIQPLNEGLGLFAKLAEL